MDKTLIQKAQTLWADPGIQEVYRRRSDFHLMTNADYFIACAERILQDEYLPTVEDILRMRYVTRGVVEHRHELKNIIITMYDMGGQRPERENWARQILDPSAILFLASLSEFDQNVEEATEYEVSGGWGDRRGGGERRDQGGRGEQRIREESGQKKRAHLVI